jgi:hypothetical protein
MHSHKPGKTSPPQYPTPKVEPHKASQSKEPEAEEELGETVDLDSTQTYRSLLLELPSTLTL